MTECAKAMVAAGAPSSSPHLCPLDNARVNYMQRSCFFKSQTIVKELDLNLSRGVQLVGSGGPVKEILLVFIFCQLF